MPRLSSELGAHSFSAFKCPAQMQRQIELKGNVTLSLSLSANSDQPTDAASRPAAAFVLNHDLLRDRPISPHQAPKTLHAPII